MALNLLRTAGHSLDLIPVTEESIAAAKQAQQEDRDKLHLLRMVDAYGVDRVERWLRAVRASVTPGSILDPRR